MEVSETLCFSSKDYQLDVEAEDDRSASLASPASTSSSLAFASCPFLKTNFWKLMAVSN